MFPRKIVWYSMALLISVACLFTLNTSPVFAQSVDDYFEYTYQINLSKTSISGDEPFSVTVTGQATCKKDLPLDVSEAYIIGRIIAQHRTTKNEIVLNPEYRLEIKPFPSKEGDTAEDTLVVGLSFPADSESGTYNIIGQLIEAKVKFVIWWDVTKLFSIPETQEIGTVTYEASSGGNGGGGGGGGGGSGTTEPDNDLSGSIDSNGRFSREVTVESANNKVELTIAEGTTGLTATGKPLSEITITGMEESPSPPEHHGSIGLTYQLGPDGATFDPPITITFTYNDSSIPDGVPEEKLALAFWESSIGEWVKLDSVVNSTDNIITAEISHFTPFTILVSTQPASFVVTDLSITPHEVYVGQTVTISVLVTNTGDIEGSHELTLTINNTLVETREVTLAGGASQTVTFRTSRDVAGTCVVIVDGLSETFGIKKLAPANFAISNLSINPLQVDIGEAVTVSVRVTNTGESSDTYEVNLKIDDVVVDSKQVTLDGGDSVIVPLTVSRDSPGTYTVCVDDKAGQFMVKGPSVPPEPKPAAFTVSHLTISPTEVETGEKVTISVFVANTGELSGSYRVTLKINDRTVATEDVTLEGKSSREVSFTVTESVAEAYSINVNDLHGTLVVNAPSPIVKRAYWWLIGTIVAGIVVVAGVTWILLRRRRA